MTHPPLPPGPPFPGYAGPPPYPSQAPYPPSPPHAPYPPYPPLPGAGRGVARGEVPGAEAYGMTPEEFARAYPPLPYHQLHRAGRRGWWWPLLGIVALLVSMFVLSQLIVVVGFVLFYAVTGQDVGERVTTLLDLGDPGPATLAFVMLGLAILTPFVWGVTRLCHGLSFGWLVSVARRPRWGFMAACTGLSFVAIFASLLVGALVSPLAGDELAGGEVSGQLNDFTSTTRDFLLVVVLLVPFQAAAEEFVFRGYLTQAAGGLFRDRRVSATVAVLVPALLFALAHGSQSFPIFFDRFAFGVVAGILVILTGGLEAGIALHVVNNWIAFAAALAFGDIGSALQPSGGSWWSIPVTLTQSVVYVALAVLVARLMKLRTTADPTVLVASRARVYGSVSAP